MVMQVGGRGRRLSGRCKGGTAVDANPTAGAAAGGGRNRDVDRPVEGLQQLPEHCGGHVAEDGAIAAGENSRHEANAMTRCAVSNYVDALMNTVQPPSLRPLGHPAAPQPQRLQLARGNDPLLPSGDFVDAEIKRVAFLNQIETKATGLSVSPPCPAVFRATWAAELRKRRRRLPTTRGRRKKGRVGQGGRSASFLQFASPGQELP
jgi:hypothetical protein